MSQNGKLMPNLDEKSTKLLNLTVLQRIDPFVEEILITAAHVTFYEFNIDNSQWSRKDVEGSLFVVKRNTQPRFQFIVMNRRNTDNLVENLLGDFEYEVQIPYLLYRNASQEVNGIWFYNARECEEVANLFSRILNAYAKVPTKSKVSPTKSEFEELEVVPSLTVMDGPLEPSASNPSNAADVPDDRSFMNFFSKTKHMQNAMNIRNPPNVAISGQPYHSSSSVVSAHPQNVTLTTLPSPSAQKPTTLSASTPIMSVFENPESVSKRSTDLVKPSSFFGTLPSSSSPSVMPPMTPSVPTAPPLNTPGNQQRPYGAPLLQPFPPPTPPPSLTPTAVGTPNYGPVISREKVGEALQMLVQVCNLDFLCIVS
ncbi:mRNA-decapping enzyme-like protein [Phtheirospermum japonicum]|uniref:mRNA-decapping enzyme-like protein n=1 Tax=Phtheirospermum japonicum TaxID=374723 RepID=A0A830D162_9LAMI|nr:mRNA-decapping enzyme-like protein [Phtheirospermum japonicum]